MKKQPYYVELFWKGTPSTVYYKSTSLEASELAKVKINRFSNRLNKVEICKIIELKGRTQVRLLRRWTKTKGWHT